MNSDEKENKVKDLISVGTELAGSAAGGAIGFLVGGLPGAAGGNALGVAIAKSTGKLLSDFVDRSLSERERVRVGGTAALAISTIQEFLESGYKPRNDGFFEEQGNQSSDAEEIFEGALLKSKNDHEEKKAKIYANIFAMVAFNSTISSGEANYILQKVATLTYRLMCFYSLILRKKQIQDIRLRSTNYRDSINDISDDTISLLQEIHPLYSSGWILINDELSGATIPMEWFGTVPSKLILTKIGNKYYETMKLQDIPEEDIIEVAKHLT